MPGQVQIYDKTQAKLRAFPGGQGLIIKTKTFGFMKIINCFKRHQTGHRLGHHIGSGGVAGEVGHHRRLPGMYLHRTFIGPKFPGHIGIIGGEKLNFYFPRSIHAQLIGIARKGATGFPVQTRNIAEQNIQWRHHKQCKCKHRHCHHTQLGAEYGCGVILPKTFNDPGTPNAISGTADNTDCSPQQLTLPHLRRCAKGMVGGG